MNIKNTEIEKCIMNIVCFILITFPHTKNLSKSDECRTEYAVIRNAGTSKSQSDNTSVTALCYDIYCDAKKDKGFENVFRF